MPGMRQNFAVGRLTRIFRLMRIFRPGGTARVCEIALVPLLTAKYLVTRR